MLPRCPRRDGWGWPVAASRISILPSWPAEASHRPSGLQATEPVKPYDRPSWHEREEFLARAGVPDLLTRAVVGPGRQPPAVRAPGDRVDRASCPGSVRIAVPVPRSQILAVASSLPEASRRPSGSQASEPTWRVWPWSTRDSFPWATSRIQIAPSLPPKARDLPSGLQAIDLTSSLWPPRVNTSSPVAALRTVIVFLSAPRAARRRPSGLHAIPQSRASTPARVRAIPVRPGRPRF